MLVWFGAKDPDEIEKKKMAPVAGRDFPEGERCIKRLLCRGVKMASDDFSIKTKITLDTKNYEAGIKKAESATQKFSSSLSGVTKLLKSTFALAGISVGTKAIVNFGKEAVKSAESANKDIKHSQ